MLNLADVEDDDTKMLSSSTDTLTSERSWESAFNAVTNRHINFREEQNVNIYVVSNYEDFKIYTQ